MSTDLLQFINKFSFTIFKEHFLHNLLVFLYIIYNTECCCFSLVVLILSRFPYRPFWSPEHLDKSQLDLHPCRHSAEEGEQKQVWELSRQPESHWPCKYMEGETGGEMHSLTHWVRGALFFYRQEWGMSSQKWERSPRAPSLGCWT